MPDLFQMIKELSAIHGASGGESRIAASISELVRPFADTVKTDALGNVIANKKGSGPKVMISAAMDTPALYVTYIDGDGFARFAAMGGIDLRALHGAAVVFKNGTVGAVSFEAGNGKDADADDMYIDIGAPGRDAALEKISFGGAAVFYGETLLAGDRIISPHISNRACCAALLRVMETKPETDCDLYCVFTVQNALGARGIKTAAQSIAPEYALTLDTASADDIPGGGKNGGPALGGGPCIKIMDDSLICDTRVIQALEKAALSLNMTVQRTVCMTERSEAGAVAMTRSGVYTGGVGLPVRYRNRQAEIASVGDIENAVRLIGAFMENIR